MASTWFRGGVDAVYGSSNGWSNGDLRASLVSGAAGINVDRTWQTLADFSSQNPLVGTEYDIVFGGRGEGWSSGVDGQQLWFEGQMDFGVVGAGTSLAGVVYYEGPRDPDPSAAPLWFCAENSGGPISANGQTVKWGTGATNICARWLCIQSLSRLTFQGTIDTLINQASLWQNASWNLGYALVEIANSATPQRNWRYMTDLSGVTWCSGAEPGATAQPVTAVADRLGPTFVTDEQRYDIRSDAAGRTAVTWPDTVLTAGETIVAVVVFMYTGSYNAASARVISWDDVADHTILAGQAITYIQLAQHTINRVTV